MTPKQAQSVIDEEKRLLAYEGSDKIVSSYEMRSLLKDYQEDRHIKSKLPSLDSYIKGFFGGEITTISGLTSMGKTLFAQSLTKNFTEDKVSCLWFTYEVPPHQFLSYFGNELPLFYLPQELKDSKLDWLTERITEAKLKYDTKVVFIDHLHYLVDMGHNMSVEIGATMRYLKKLALRLNVCIFLIAHTMKLKYEEEMDNDSLRDSSFIAQESDNVFFVWRKKGKDFSENESTLKITKNRRFGVIGKKIQLIKVGNFLREKATDDGRTNPF